jgi:hypothetical protein
MVLRHNKHLLDGHLVQFLDRKRLSSKITDQISISGVFESIFPKIRQLYLDKLEERDAVDEFQTENVAAGIPSIDGLFYEKYFLPSCLFYMYKEWLKHNNFEETNMKNDLFIIGSGSKTYTLYPEVHGICTGCVSSVDLRFESFDESGIKEVNVAVFRMQKRDDFGNPAVTDILGDGDSNGSNNMVCCNPFNSDSDDEINKTEEFKCNPFDSSSNSETEENLDNCDICYQSFPSEDFVKIHKKVFHNTKGVKAIFVAEAEELMTSFVEEPSQKPQSPNVVEGSSSKPRTSKSKYTLRNHLKF